MEKIDDLIRCRDCKHQRAGECQVAKQRWHSVQLGVGFADDFPRYRLQNLVLDKPRRCEFGEK